MSLWYGMKTTGTTYICIAVTKPPLTAIWRVSHYHSHSTPDCHSNYPENSSNSNQQNLPLIYLLCKEGKVKTIHSLSTLLIMTIIVVMFLQNTSHVL